MNEYLPVVFLALSVVAVVVLLRVARSLRLLRTNVGQCACCGRGAVPVTGVYYGKNTGMLVARLTRVVEGTLCRRCSLVEGGKATLHTAVLGWWGTISFFLTLLILPSNLAQLLWALSLPSADSLATHALEEHREYAAALLATKDRATVVDVLTRQTNASPAQVERFLASVAE